MFLWAVEMEFKVRNLMKSYHKNIIINDFSYNFKSGLYLLTSKNGTGKSTLLKLLAKVINNDNKNSFIENKKIAYLCEKVEIGNCKALTFLRDISALNYSKRNIKEVMKEWKLPNKGIDYLSKGNKQKCSLLMIFLTDADIFLFDEPTDALDMDTVKLFINEVKKLLNDGKIVIIATHKKEYFKNLNYVLVDL